MPETEHTVPKSQIDQLFPRLEDAALDHRLNSGIGDSNGRILLNSGAVCAARDVISNGAN